MSQLKVKDLEPIFRSRFNFNLGITHYLHHNFTAAIPYLKKVNFFIIVYFKNWQGFFNFQFMFFLI
jgi:hypothetical protein